ncbi:hypothetical protein [Dongia sedimenti]|uniref:Phage tail tape measure protein n=1 Tax=Dongia sedimenti TaxID=3064282 RepID=A0ABU0YXK6_9PROT|nr:hypothetical protein [Rhodospirillaceae bacterium R-7]
MSLFSAISTAIGAGASIYGAVSSSKANSKAAKNLAKAEREKVALQREIYGDMQEQSAPAVSYFRSAIARTDGLTPQQEADREDLRRQTLNDLSRTSLWGSGRGVTAALKRINSDYTLGAQEQNRQEKNQAAGQLAGGYFTAGDALARGEGDAITSTAQAKADAGLANSGLRGQAIGDIAGLIQSEIKGRDSAYADDLGKIRKAFGLRDTEPAI